jgi:hypothetical protein
MGLINTNRLTSDQEDEYLLSQSFVTRTGAGTVTVNGRNYGTDLAITRSANGVYLLTFAAPKKPFKASCWANVRGNTNVTANATYDQSTGVVTVRLWTQAGAADNTDLLTVDVFMLASKSRSAK